MVKEIEEEIEKKIDKRIEKNKDKKAEKKKLTIKEIGIERLIIILLCGIFLIVVSVPDLFSFAVSGKNSDKSKVNRVNQSTGKTDASNASNTNNYVDQLEEQLKQALEKVDGIGKVDVMITLKSTKERVVLKDSPYTQETSSETDSAGGSRVSSNVSKQEESVIVDSENGDKQPFIIKEIEPEIEGIVVIAEGGGDSGTISEIISAVEVLFDVPSHKIKVMKMNVSK
jgi:Stage III sporulation protein AF (Spore_III_AF).